MRLPGLHLDISEVIQFFSLAKKRFESNENLFRFQRFQGEKLFERKEFSFKDEIILEIGCGTGGFGSAASDLGGKVFLMDYEFMDLNPSIKEKFRGRIIKADGLALPFKEEAFGFLICSSVIEHVDRPGAFIEEVYRILRKSGICYLSYPPFFSLKGGHHIAPFHFLGENIGIKAWSLFFKKRLPAKDLRYANLWGKFGLTPLTIKDVEAMIRKTPMKIQKISTRFCSFNFAKIPILRELLTWHVEFFLKK